MSHPDQIDGYIRRVQIVAKMKVWKNKEDSHGGPGYYEHEVILGQKDESISPSNVQNYVDLKR